MGRAARETKSSRRFKYAWKIKACQTFQHIKRRYSKKNHNTLIIQNSVTSKLGNANLKQPGGFGKNRPHQRWDKAKEIFPRKNFPWHVFPTPIKDCLNQLARSMAISPLCLPGMVFAFCSAAIGRKATVEIKHGWTEPFIFWVADIRTSGDGKTPAMKALRTPFYDLQKNEEEHARKEQERYDALPKGKKEKAPKPKPARNYFLTGFTLEGIRDALAGHPTGGIIVTLNELSAFITGQNQYKTTGNDREAWLELFDGTPNKTVRAGGKNIWIDKSAVSLIGGIQPDVWRHIIHDKTILIHDETLFRMLCTFEFFSFYELTDEEWSQQHQKLWSDVIIKIFRWADNIDDTLVIKFSNAAKQYFYCYRNNLYAIRNELPDPLNGFIPKSISYIARIAGVLHILSAFVNNRFPHHTIELNTVKDAIAVIRFYLGQIVDAVMYVHSQDEIKKTELVRSDARAILLAQVLRQERDNVENGLLGIGYLYKKINETACSTIFSSPRSFGAYLKNLGLETTGKHNFRGQRGVRCLKWNDRVENFLQQFADIADVRRTVGGHRNQSESLDLSISTDNTNVADVTILNKKN